MHQLFTPAELSSKGLRKDDIVRMLRRSKRRVDACVKEHLRNGGQCGAAFHAQWDAECARWDHLKATLMQYG